MLWYKAWLETRSRFLIALIGLTAICSDYVFHGDRNTLPYTGISWYNGVLHGANNILVLTWIMAVILLAMGGLLREKSSGASLFTLALPASRTRLISIRIAVALIQAILLVIVPWAAMFLVDAVFGKSHSLPQAIFSVVLLLGGGLIYFAAAILVSSLVEGEYTAPVVGFGIIILTAVALAEPPLRAYNPWVFMTGSEYLDKSTALLKGPIPWTHVAANIAVSVLLLLAAIRSIQKRDLT
jgi:ABC-type transport system involved in multi-copper enzyme maturation permease subunit